MPKSVCFCKSRVWQLGENGKKVAMEAAITILVFSGPQADKESPASVEA